MKIIYFIIMICFSMLIGAGCEEKKIEAPPPAIISIVSSPSGATIWHNGKECGQTPFKMEVKSGHLMTLIAELPGYEKAINIASSTSGKTTECQFELNPILGAMVIYTVPDKAKVFVDGLAVGTSPINCYNLRIGEHVVSVEAPGFMKKETRLMIPEDGSSISRKIALESNIGKLNIQSDPEGATVLVDGDLVGATPYTNDFVAGEHVVTLRKGGYSEVVKNVVVQRNKEETINLALVVLPGKMKISANLSDASIFVNDEYRGKVPLTIDPIDPGPYTVRVEKEGFDKEEKEVRVLPDQTLAVSFDLSSNTGGIDVVTVPGAIVYVDGKKIGLAKPTATKGETTQIVEVRNLSMGEHSVRVFNKNATPEQLNVTVSVNKNEIVQTSPLLLWIPDTELTYLKMNNKKVKGKLIKRAADELEFEPSKGIRQLIKSSNIIIKPIPMEE